MRKVNLLILFASVTLIAGILIQSNMPAMDLASDWQYSDVRLIDPIDAVDASSDIIAVLSRQQVDTIQIRIDFMSLELGQDFCLLLYLDHQPGGVQIPDGISNADDFAWDTLIEYYNIGRRLTSRDSSGSSYGRQLRVTQDVVQDTLVVNTQISNDSFQMRSARVLVILKSTSSAEMLDFTSPIALSAEPPSPLTIKLLFWNIMDSSTPATILRSWAGAHTGPQSSRHGLSYLFTAVQDWEVPIGICDFYNRDIIFGVNYLQRLPELKDLALNTLVQSENCDHAIGYAQINSSDWPANDILRDQPALTRYLLGRYFSSSDYTVILGGDFSKSILGDPEVLKSVFSFLDAHPWIHVAQSQLDSRYTAVNSSQIEQPSNKIPYTVSGQQIASGLTNLDLQALIRAELTRTPPNEISRLASEIYTNLLDSYKPNVVIAQGSYLSQIGHMLEASIWADDPQAISTCGKDIDWDGQPECILATNDIFLSFELEGGYLAYGFVQNENGYHQIIGPTTQFDTLRSDPSTLSAEKGIAGDSGQIIGAFADPLSSLQTYSGSVASGKIALTSQDGSMEKTFLIQDGEIHIQILAYNQVTRPIGRLPFVLDPWLRGNDQSAGIYWEQQSQNAWIWGVSDQISIGVESNLQFSHDTFNATYGALNKQEDPNFDYTDGHLLPIPMAVAEFLVQPVTTIVIEIDPG